MQHVASPLNCNVNYLDVNWSASNDNASGSANDKAPQKVDVVRQLAKTCEMKDCFGSVDFSSESDQETDRVLHNDRQPLVLVQCEIGTTDPNHLRALADVALHGDSRLVSRDVPVITVLMQGPGAFKLEHGVFWLPLFGHSIDPWHPLPVPRVWSGMRSCHTHLAVSMIVDPAAAHVSRFMVRLSFGTNAATDQNNNGPICCRRLVSHAVPHRHRPPHEPQVFGPLKPSTMPKAYSPTAPLFALAFWNTGNSTANEMKELHDKIDINSAETKLPQHAVHYRAVAEHYQEYVRQLANKLQRHRLTAPLAAIVARFSYPWLSWIGHSLVVYTYCPEDQVCVSKPLKPSRAARSFLSKSDRNAIAASGLNLAAYHLLGVQILDANQPLEMVDALPPHATTLNPRSTFVDFEPADDDPIYDA